jgi:hypothetical protein
MQAMTENFISTEIELLDYADEPKVLGEPGEIRGGLFRFIDDATNPKSSKKVKSDSNGLCLVCALVNEFGSMLLRELLESSEKSRTHRLGVHKRGLVFILSLTDGSQMTPQLESRSHQIIDEFENQQ